MDEKLVDEILAAKRFIFAMTDEVRHILVTQSPTDYTVRCEDGRFDIFLTKLRYIDGQYIPVLPAVLHEYGHILFSRLEYGETYDRRYAAPEEIVVNSLLLQKRFPSAWKDLADIYVSKSDWFMQQLKNTSRDGIIIDPSGINHPEAARLPELFDQAKRFSTLNERAAIYDEILRIVESSQDHSGDAETAGDSSGFTIQSLLEAFDDIGLQWCSMAHDNTTNIHNDSSVDEINTVLRDLQDRIESEMRTSAASQFVRYEQTAMAEPDPDLVRQIRIAIRSRRGERSQFVHNLHDGRISLKNPAKLRLGMYGASNAYHKRRADGNLDVCIGVLVDSSGSMDIVLQNASVAAASIFAALDGQCNVIIGTFGDDMYYSDKGMPNVTSHGSTPGYTATFWFQNHIRQQPESKKYILVLSDFEYTDSKVLPAADIPVFGLGYFAKDVPDGVRYAGEATAENICKFFMEKVK